jgi:hypothetical protein
VSIRRPNRNRKPDRATIRKLALTWPIRQLRDVIVPPLQGEERDPEWSWKYEQEYGLPDWEDREVSLALVLNVLSDGGKRDLQPIIAVLHEIRGLAYENARLGWTLKHRRENAEEADRIRRNLVKWLKPAIRLHQRLNPDDLSSPLRFRRMYEAMLTALTFPERMTDEETDEERTVRDWLLSPSPPSMTRRRKARGNPDAVLVREAHRLLTRARVPREHHRELLWAIGLLDKNGNLQSRQFSPATNTPRRHPRR